MLGLDVLNVFVRVVHHGVKPGSDVQQRVLHRFQDAAEAAVQLGGGVAGGGGGFGVDEVGDCLGLGKVHAPVEEGTFRELPRPRLPRPGGKQGVQQLPQDGGGTVAVEFGGVLAGVAVGRGEADGKPLIQHPALPVQHLAETQLPRLQFPESASRRVPEHPGTSCVAAVAGDPHNADGGGRVSRGNRGDQIHKDRLLSITA